MSAQGRYRLSIDEPGGATLGHENTYDRACAVAREASRAGIRVRVALNTKSGRQLAAYEDGREKFYTYAGGREF
jgi:hypothetical protein